MPEVAESPLSAAPPVLSPEAVAIVGEAPPVAAAKAMAEDPPAADFPFAWGAGASVAIHGLVLLLLAAVFVTQAPPSPGERPIAVEILSPEDFARLAAPEAPDRVPEMPDRVPALPAPAPKEVVRPTRMLSAAALADPRSREARALLPTLDDTERMIQLCGLEAMEQVHAWRASLDPDRIVAYALSEPEVGADSVDARGAAFRSGGVWYGLSFDCRLSPDRADVIAFAFQVGEAVPRDQWEARSLPADTGPAPD